MIKFMLFHGAAEQSAVLFIPENYGTRTISKNNVEKKRYNAVSYTHLTLPTNREV